MPRTPQFTSWVVYETIQPGKPKMTTVCGQPEWDAMELTQPNYHVLIRAGITNEGEAERLARSGAIVEKVRELRKKPVVPLSDAAGVSVRPVDSMGVVGHSPSS